MPSLRPEKARWVPEWGEGGCRWTEEGGGFLVRDEVGWWGFLLAVGRRWGPCVLVGGGGML